MGVGCCHRKVDGRVCAVIEGEGCVRCHRRGGCVCCHRKVDVCVCCLGRGGVCVLS